MHIQRIRVDVGNNHFNGFKLFLNGYEIMESNDGEFVPYSWMRDGPNEPMEHYTDNDGCIIVENVDSIEIETNNEEPIGAFFNNLLVQSQVL
jgi:hypothetical protein